MTAIAERVGVHVSEVSRAVRAARLPDRGLTRLTNAGWHKTAILDLMAGSDLDVLWGVELGRKATVAEVRDRLRYRPRRTESLLAHALACKSEKCERCHRILMEVKEEDSLVIRFPGTTNTRSEIRAS